MKRYVLPGVIALMAMVLLALALVGVAAAFTSVEPVNGIGDGVPEVTPTQVAGNPTCAQYGCVASCYYKVDPPVFGATTTYDGTDGVPCDNVITTTIDSTGVYLTWTSENPVCAVIMKGGNQGANVYIYMYPPGTISDDGLRPPDNINNDGSSSGPAQISHVEFCYGPAPPKYCISGYKTDYCTGNGLKDWTITLTKPGGATFTCTTAENGYYEFCGLLAGSYTVAETVKDGWFAVSPESIGPITVGPSSEKNNFTNNHNFCVNGTLEEKSGGSAEGYTIKLFEGVGTGGTLLGTDITDKDGIFGENNEFCGLAPGEYTFAVYWPGITTPIATSEFQLTKTTCKPEITIEFDQPLWCISGYKLDKCTGAGLEGWTVTLTKPDNTQVTCTTAANGYYQFCRLLAGTYAVNETLKDGWKAVIPADVDAGLSVTLAGTADSTNNNFTNQQLLCISGTKTDKCTKDGIEGVWINLFKGTTATGTPFATCQTAADGSFSFCNLEPGAYVVNETAPAGYMGAPDIPVTLTACGADYTTANFENQPLLCISGKKTDKCSGAGIKDVWINLFKGTTATGTPFLTCQTAADGRYSFCGLEPGDYVVNETAPAGYMGAPDVPVTLSCEDCTTANFENVPLVCISGTKKVDGVVASGWIMRLYKGTEVTGTPIATCTTAADGRYSFCGLEPGTYTVNETQKTGYIPTPPATGSLTVTLTACGGDYTTADFANSKLYSSTANGLGFMTGSTRNKDLYTDTVRPYFSLITTKNNNWFMWNKVPGDDATNKTFPIQIGTPKTGLRIIGEYTIIGTASPYTWGYTITPGTTFTMNGKTYKILSVSDARIGVQDNDPYRFTAVPGQDCTIAPGATFTASEPFYVFAHFVVSYIQVV